ncbi:MAG: hypothetical protein HQM01_08260 [Magnetococcales bacterium]|nr:hypothetical protein [Magnetococcales bacterium]
MRRHEARIVVPTLEQMEALAGKIGASDLEELAASHGMQPFVGIYLSVRQSREAWAGIVDGALVGIFGVGLADHGPDVGVPWLVPAEDLKQHAGALLTCSRQFVERWRREYALLQNHVHVGNARSIRWLRWLGFTIDPPRPWGVRGALFHRFWMRGDGDVFRN